MLLSILYDDARTGKACFFGESFLRSRCSTAPHQVSNFNFAIFATHNLLAMADRRAKISSDATGGDMDGEQARDQGPRMAERRFSVAAKLPDDFLLKQKQKKKRKAKTERAEAPASAVVLAYRPGLRSERNVPVAVASECKCSGNGLSAAIIRQAAHFTIEAYDETGNKLSVGGEPFKVDLRGSSLVRARVTDNENGTYTVSYVPTGAHSAHTRTFYFNADAFNDIPLSVLRSERRVPHCHLVTRRLPPRLSLCHHRQLLTTRPNAMRPKGRRIAPSRRTRASQL